MLLTDLNKEMNERLDKDEQLVVMGDFNRSVKDERIAKLFEEANMREVVTKRHENTPKMHIRNQVGTTIDGIWATRGLWAIKAGYTDYVNDFDHRMVWVDFMEEEVFGHKQIANALLNARRLQIVQPKVCERYKNRLLKVNEQHSMLQGMSILESEACERHMKDDWLKELNEMDTIRANAMLQAERKCRKLRAEAHPCSPQRNVVGAGIRFLRLALKHKLGKKVSSRKIESTQKKAVHTGVRWRNMLITLLRLMLKNRIEQLKRMQDGTNTQEARRMWLQKLADEHQEAYGTSSKNVYKQLLHKERSRKKWKMILLVVKEGNRYRLSQISIPDPQGNGRTECYTENAIVQTCLKKNKNYQ
jgi:hypothetical protein